MITPTERQCASSCEMVDTEFDSFDGFTLLRNEAANEGLNRALNGSGVFLKISASAQYKVVLNETTYCDATLEEARLQSQGIN